jgi:hypothetical protein
VADALGAPEPEGVVKPSVDQLRVIAPTVQTREVGVAGRDWAHVFGTVEAASFVVGVCA